MSFKVYGYKAGSRSAKALADSLGGKVLKHVGSKYRGRMGDTVVNWGSSAVPIFKDATTLNTAEAVAVASDKLKTFDVLQAKEVRIPPHWTAQGGGDQVYPVVCRTKLRGHSGDGMYNEREQKAYVLEVNTACGLEERTAERYAEAIRSITD